jgi:hypothetical protein
MAFPDSCLKGIPNDDYIVEDGSVGTHLFYFDEKHTRDDGWIEQSINWEDDDTVLELTLNQKKESGELQFRAGVAKISQIELNRLSTQPTVSGIFSYERRTLENNPYHGNLLLRSGTPKPTMKKIAAGIALAISEVIRRG